MRANLFPAYFPQWLTEKLDTQDINKNRRWGRVQSSSLGLMNPLVFGFLALSDSALAAARKEEV